MKRTVWNLLVLLLALSLNSTGFAQGVGPGQGARGNGGQGNGIVQSLNIPAGRQKAAMAFWTRAALAAAEAFALPADAGAAEVDAAALAAELAAATVVGDPGFVAAGAASAEADGVAQAAYAADWAALEEMTVEAMANEPAGSSQVFTHYIVNKNSALWKAYPHRWVGRLSFSTPSGTSFCSATSISGNVMLTAAHCLYDTSANAWYSNWVFSPAYRNGNAPYGTFPATTCWVLTAWINLGGYSINGAARHDVGVCKMGNNSAGQTLNNAVGWMGRQWNFPYIRHFHNLGYPFRNSSDALITDAGKYLHACVAESFQQTTETRGAGCPVSRGMSGGPWVVNYQPFVVSGNADGVNSGFFIGTTNLYAARFNSNNIVPLCNAAGC